MEDRIIGVKESCPLTNWGGLLLVGIVGLDESLKS